MESYPYIRKLVSEMMPLIRGRVKAARLAIWPDSDWPVDTDTVLCLDLQLGRRVRKVVVKTSADGQTPEIRDEVIKAKYTLAQLTERIEEWRRKEALPDYRGSIREAFDLAGSTEFGWLIGRYINSFDLVCYEDDLTPCGLLINFDNGGTTWTTGGTNGNVVGSEFSSEFLGFPIIKIRIDADVLSIWKPREQS